MLQIKPTIAKVLKLLSCNSAVCMKEDEHSFTVFSLPGCLCAGLLLLSGYNVELIVKKEHVLEMMNLVSAQLTGVVNVF